MPALLWCYYSETTTKGNELLFCITHQSQSTGLRVESESVLLFTPVSREGNSLSLKLYRIEAHPTMLCHSLTLITNSSVDAWVIPPLSWISNPIELFYSTIILFGFQGKPFNITVFQAYAPTTNTEEAEVEWFYEDQQPFRTNTPQNVLFIIGDWNAKVGSQETPGVTCKFGLGVRNETGQRLIEVFQKNTLVVADTLFP